MKTLNPIRKPAVTDRIETWSLWVIVTGIGCLVSLFLALTVTQIAGSALPSTVGLLVSGAISGALLGLTQWMFLHPKVVRIDAWALASALGWLVGLAITAQVVRTTYSPLGAALGGALGGLVFGVSQSATLHAGTRDNIDWIVTTIAGWVVALVIGILLRGGDGPTSMQAALLDIAYAWTTGGVIAGLVLIVLLVTLFPKREEKNQRSPVDWWP